MFVLIIVTCNTALHKKGEFPLDQLCRFIAYTFEKYYKFNNENQLVIFFNLTGSGFSNMDMDLTKFLVNCLMHYYPRIAGIKINYLIFLIFIMFTSLIAYTVVLNMPFIYQGNYGPVISLLKSYTQFFFKAAWKIIKLWLSPGIAEMVKFVDNNTIKEYITDEEILKNLKQF